MGKLLWKPLLCVSKPYQLKDPHPTVVTHFAIKASHQLNTLLLITPYMFTSPPKYPKSAENLCMLFPKAFVIAPASLGQPDPSSIASSNIFFKASFF
jgi:hypothetical protein